MAIKEPSAARTWKIVLAAVLLAVTLAAPQFLSLHWTNRIIQILILGLFALSNDLLIGHAGLLPLGHAGFFAVSAYVTAILQMKFGQHFVVASLAGVFASALVATLFGFAIRTVGVYFILLTLALGTVIWGIAFRWVSMTGGDNGLVGIQMPPIAGIDMANLTNYYYLVVVVVGLCLIGYRILIQSPFGLSLRGLRESDSRMRGLGFNVTAHKFAAWVLSGTLAGIAGVLFVYWNKFVSPAAAHFSRSAEAVLMVILGGSGTILGPFLGSAVISWIRVELGGVVTRFMSVMGIVFILTALYAPDGLVGLARRLWTSVGKARLGGSVARPAAPGKKVGQ